MSADSSTTVTLRLPEELKGKLDRLAEATERSRSWLAQDAIRRYIEMNEWQVAEIREGVREADAGQFASGAEVAALREKWSGNEAR